MAHTSLCVLRSSSASQTAKRALAFSSSSATFLSSSSSIRLTREICQSRSRPVTTPRRLFSACPALQFAVPDATTTPPDPPLSPRWLSSLKSRLGRCITFGLNPPQTANTAQILQTLSRDWRSLLAGSEGYLTGEDRAGLLRQRVVWGDMDCMSHVNNVTYNKWAESGRIEWANKYAIWHDKERAEEWRELWSPRGKGLILRSIRTDYKFPMTWPDRVSVFHKLRDQPTLDTDSFILDVMILSERQQRPAARCVEDIVVYDYKLGKKTPLRPFMADKFKETFALQEAAKKKNLQIIDELTRRVRELELESWDRKDAVEDMGAGSS